MRSREEPARSFNSSEVGTWRAWRRIGFTLFSVAGLTWVVGCAAVPAPVSGLRPHYPEPSLKFPHVGEHSLTFVEVDSLQPTLTWEVFPRPIDLVGDNEGARGRINNVTYDLRIWRAEEESPQKYPAEIVYERRGLREPSHTIEQPLTRSTKYFWSIRARFELDGRPRVTQWGVTRTSDPGAHRPRLAVVPRADYYRFETPSSPTHPTGQRAVGDAEALGRAPAGTQHNIATTMPQETQTAYLTRPESPAQSAEPVTPTLKGWLFGEWTGTRESTWGQWEATIRITSYNQAAGTYKGDGYLLIPDAAKWSGIHPRIDLVVTAVIDEKERVVMTTDHSNGRSFTFNLKRTRDDRLSGETAYGLPRLSLKKKR